MATQELITLNSVLKNKDIGVLFQENTDELFTAYGDVWQGIKDYYSKYRDIPDAEIIQERWPDFEPVDTKGNTEYHLELLKSEYISHKIEQLILKAGSKISPETAGLVLNGMLGDLGKLGKFSHSVRDVDIMDMDAAKQHYDAVRAKAEAMGGVPGISTGIGFIDSCITSGLQPGDLIPIIGYPARGKSALGALLASNFYNNGFKPMVVSLEMPASAYRDRIYTIMGSGLFKNSELSLGIMNTDNFRTFAGKIDNTVSFPVIEGDGSPMTPNMVQSKIDEHRPDIVILDYLQLMHDNAQSTDMTTRIRQLSLEIKAMAMANKIPIICIASATPPDGGRVDGPPSNERIAWSKQVSYDSSLTIAIHKDDDAPIFQVECAKNRYGPLFAGILDWDIDNGIIKEIFDPSLA